VAGLSIDLDEVRAATWAIICGEYGEHTLVKHLDPFCGAVKPVADCYGEVWVLSVFDIPLRALLEVIFIGFNLGFKSGNSLLEMPLLLDMVLFPNSDSTDQRGCNSMEGDCIDVSF
jgi:hypothetical protein